MSNMDPAVVAHFMEAGRAIPEPYRRKFWTAAEDLANIIGHTVVEGAPRSYGEPNPRDIEILRLREEIFRAGQDKLVSGDFLQEEVLFWRRKYEMLWTSLVDLNSKISNEIPPEPPVGTKFTNSKRGVLRREVDGWHCGSVDDNTPCPNCPMDWAEAEIYTRGATRILPGVITRVTVAEAAGADG
jgi:hypothetical protein